MCDYNVTILNAQLELDLNYLAIELICYKKSIYTYINELMRQN